MKSKTWRVKTLLCLCLFVVFIFAFAGIKISDAEKASATDTVEYYSVSSSDFEVYQAGKTSTDFLFRLDYIGDVQEITNSLTKYTPFETEQTALQTNDGLVDLKNATAYATRFAVYIACTPINAGSVGFDENTHTKIIIPKGQQFTKSGVGFQFADDLTLVKTDEDTWEVATVKETVSVQITVNGETTEEEIEKDGAYTLPAVSALKGKTFVGWEICGKSYSVGETVQISDHIDEETQSVVVQARYLDYSLMEGASIRYDKDMASSGIRFTAILNGVTELPSYITGLGVIVMPNDMIGKTDFTLDNFNGAGQAKDFFVQTADISTDENGDFTFRATIISVLEQNYNRAFSARAYLTAQTNDGESRYIWCDGIETRSVYQVATLALDDDSDKNTLTTSQKIVLQTYVNKVANITYDGNTVTIVSAVSTPAITAVSATKTGETVTLYLQTSKSNFLALTYNGVRIKDFSVQVRENGLTIIFTVDEV